MSEKDYDLRAAISKYNTVEKNSRLCCKRKNKLSEFEQKSPELDWIRT